MPMELNKINNVLGDATNPTNQGYSSTPILIPHVCNDIGAWGAGFVMALNKTFGTGPMLFYKAWCEESMQKQFSPQFIRPAGSWEETGQFGLGQMQYVHVGNRTCIANMVAQRGTRNENNPHPIRYGALIDCMRSIRKRYRELQSKDIVIPFEIHCPKFGSDLAGGSWEEIEKMINEIWVDAGIPVTVYEFVPSS